MDMMQMSNFTGITELQSLQSIQSNNGVTGSTQGFFSDFVQSLLGSFQGTDEEAANLIAGLGVFSEEQPEDNDELMEMIASMMAMGVNYNDIVTNGSFDPSSYINSAINGTGTTDYTNYSGYFNPTTYSDLLTLSTNTGTDMSALVDIATGNNYSDGQLMLELAMSSAGTNALNSSNMFGTNTGSEFDLGSYYGSSMYSNTATTDLASQLYSANSNMNSAIAQAMTATQDSSVTQVSEEPTEADILEDISSFPQYIPTSTNSTTNVEATNEVFEMQEFELDVDDLNMQIETGIKNGDITDTKEMLIKLRPEGLGEVTVKLVQTPENNIKIDIVTASEATAKLLNDNLPQLRESMRELQTEISDVIYNDNQGNAEQNAKDQAAQWAYNQEQREQRQAFDLDSFDEFFEDDADPTSDLTDKIYI